MRRAFVALLLVVAAVAGAAWWGSARGPAPAEATPSVAAAAPADADRTPGAPPADDPEALAAWFEDAVRRELDRTAVPTAPATGAPVARESAASAAAESGARALAVPAAVRGALRDTPPSAALQAQIAAGEIGPVDWDYLAQVFDGRVAGVPNERRAGLSLAQMHRLGVVPYIEELVQEGDIGRLRELDPGLVDDGSPDPATETAARELPVGWPDCVRTGTCRGDDRATWP